MRFAGLLLSGILFAGTVFAQQGPRQRIANGGALQLQALKNYLNLSDAQISDIRTVRDSMRDAHRPLVQELAAKTRALRDENQKAAPDPNVVAQLKERISDLRDQIQTQREGFQEQMRGFLNQDQLASLERLEEVVRLFPVARAAVAFDLIGSPDGAGAGRLGLRGLAGAGRMMRRRLGN
jgi:Spy/CpxP family protein refolding chaperone